MRVLVTGGAQGLGLAIVRTALSHGAEVTVLDADAPSLERLPGPVTSIRADLAVAGDVAAVLRTLGEGSPFDLVVMNAGINETGPFEHLALDRLERVIAVNLTAPMQLTAGLTRTGMLAPSGRLVFVSSLSHFVGYPGASVYAATKDGLVVFARSLQPTLRKTLGVRVQVAAPGPMDTAHAARHAPAAGRAGDRISPDRVADRIWRARRGFMIVPGRRTRIAAALGRLFPGLAGRVMRRMIYDKLAADPSLSGGPRIRIPAVHLDE